MNSGPAFSQIRMAADSELRYYFSCLMLGDSRGNEKTPSGNQTINRKSETRE